MIYFHITVQAKRGKLDEWADGYNKIFLPVAEKYGQKLVGAWKTSIGAYDEATDLYAFESLADMERIKKEMSKDPAIIKMREDPSGLTSLVAFESAKILVPLSYSPLK